MPAGHGPMIVPTGFRPTDVTQERDVVDVTEARSVRGGAEAVFRTLERWGVDRLFLCPGSTEVALLDASFDHPEIELVLATHESVAVAMADGYARATGRAAVAYLHTHVGLANGLAHLHAADVAGIPVVVLTGLKATAIQNGRGFTSNPHVRDLVRPFTRWEWQTLRAEAIAEDVDRALRLAVTTPAGPTFVGLPQDLLEADVEVPLVPAPDDVTLGHAGRSCASDADLDRAAELLRGARRPLVVAGAQLDGDDEVAAVVALVERLGAPVVVEDRRNLRALPVATDHPSYAGMLDRDGPLVADADVVVLAGVRAFTEFEPSTRPALGAGRALVQLQSSREEVVRHGPTAVALVGTPELSARALRDRLSPTPQPEVTAFRERARDDLEAATARLRDRERPVGSHLSVDTAFGHLVGSLPEDAIVVADAVTSEPALLQRLTVRRPDGYHASGGSGSLGWGMGAALGVAFANPGRRVVNVVGDGVFQFGLPALWTAVKHRLPVTVVVVNNRAYAAVRSALYRRGGRSARTDEFPVTDLSGPDLAAIGAGFGCATWQVDAAGELDEVFAAALAVDGPALVELRTDPDDLGPVRPRRPADRR